MTAPRMLRGLVSFGSMTMVSRVFGLVRDMVINSVFGANAATDAFFVAFKIPNFMRRLFAEGAFSQSFVPVLSEYKTQREHAEVQRLVDCVTGSLGGILLVITIIGVLAAPVIVAIFAPGFIDDDAKYGLTVELLRITFPYLFFISLTSAALTRTSTPAANQAATAAASTPATRITAPNATLERITPTTITSQAAIANQ